jgi:Tol biopolymer transport system component/DNA-binding winged helix-turn-helix (wHTH) protein
MQSDENRVFRFGEFTLDADKHCLLRNGSEIHLTPRSFQTLLFLLQRRGRAVTKQELLDELWGDAFVTDNVLTRCIREIRESLSDDAREPRFIRTLPRVGYKFIADVEERPESFAERSQLAVLISEETVELDQPEAGEAMETGSGSRTRRSAFILPLIGAAALLAAGALAWKVFSPADSPPSQRLVSTFAGAHSQASFSPDGSMIAFISDASGTAQVWVKHVDHGDPVQITFSEAPVARPRWSPTGGEMIYAVGAGWSSDVWSSPPLGGAPRLLIRQARNPNRSPDGNRIVFERGDQIWIADADGGNQRQVQGVPPVELLLADRTPSFSPDGSKIAFFQNSDAPHGDIWVIPAEGGEASRLTFDDHMGGTPVWTPDGRWIIYSSQRRGSLNLWRVPASGGEPTPITMGAGGDSFPEVSPDGRQVIYTNSRHHFELTLLNPETGQATSLLEARDHLTEPAFSPLGDRISFFQVAGRGDVHVFTFELAARRLFQVTRGAGEWNIHPRWSDDGRQLFYYQHRPVRSFRRIAAEGGESVLAAEGWAWGTHNAARTDPSGRLAVYTWMEKGAPMETRVQDLDTGSERSLPRILRYPRWSRDGGSVIGSDVSDSQSRLSGPLRECFLDTGECRRLGPEGYMPAFSADGSRIYFLRFGTGRDEREVWAAPREGGEAEFVATLSPLHPINTFFDVSPEGELLYVRFHAGAQELWVTEF